MKAVVVLAWMLSLQPLGASPYSAVPEREGVVCNTIRTDGCRRETREEELSRRWTIAQSIAATGDSAQAVLTVTYHESGGWRRDVHSGVGRYARGDQGRSWCLGQMLLGARNVRARRLVGIDRASTDRCIQAVARHLGAIKREQPYTKFARYGGVWSKQHKGILSRVGTFNRITRNPAPKLAADIRKALGLEAAE